MKLDLFLTLYDIHSEIRSRCAYIRPRNTRERPGSGNPPLRPETVTCFVTVPPSFTRGVHQIGAARFSDGDVQQQQQQQQQQSLLCS